MLRREKERKKHEQRKRAALLQARINKANGLLEILRSTNRELDRSKASIRRVVQRGKGLFFPAISLSILFFILPFHHSLFSEHLVCFLSIKFFVSSPPPFLYLSEPFLLLLSYPADFGMFMVFFGP